MTFKILCWVAAVGLGVPCSIPVSAGDGSTAGLCLPAVERLATEALLQTLNGRLLANPSASLTLTDWCREHGILGLGETLRAVTSHSDGPEPASLRSDLQVGDNEPIRHRHVRLYCGTHIVSEADNFFIPARLSDSMNRELETSDHPFGLVVRSLHFVRRTAEVAILWSPLPRGWEADRQLPCEPISDDSIPDGILRHRAILVTDVGRPFSEVIEIYQRVVVSVPLRALENASWLARMGVSR